MVRAAIGVGFTALAAILFTTPLGISGPIFAIAGNLATEIAMRDKWTKRPTVGVPLTDDARGLLAMLCQSQAGWRGPLYRNEDPWSVGFRHTPWAGMRTMDALPSGPARSLPMHPPSESVMSKLELAAFHFNRISGWISAEETSQPGIGRLSPRLVEAANEGMAEALNQAAIASRFPENREAALVHLDSTITMLAEIADRLEAMAKEEPNFSPRLATRNTMEMVLEELRGEQRARQELRGEDDTRHQQST